MELGEKVREIKTGDIGEITGLAEYLFDTTRIFIESDNGKVDDEWHELEEFELI